MSENVGGGITGTARNVVELRQKLLELLGEVKQEAEATQVDFPEHTNTAISAV